MAFKLTSPFPIDNTPVYHVDMEDNVLGKANNNGTIIINKDVPCDKIQDVVDHEMVHINQMRRGDLDYDDKNVYWKGKVIPRSSIKEGDSALPWEAEAYEKS
tara:strand:- start:34 stop:339 length:306 start_codon:yes stop_codon:yes gene_type:complete